MNLVTVLDHLRVKQVVGLGDGAGANIILRFAMNHPGRVRGVLAINTEGLGTAGYKEIIMVSFEPTYPLHLPPANIAGEDKGKEERKF